MDKQIIQLAVNQAEISRQTPALPLLQNLDKLPEPVKKVLTVKYAGKPFCKLTEMEQQAHAIGLLLKINVVTGWPLPESDESQNILAEQLRLYLIESWPLYNVDEIMYAIRSHAISINNWGKNMNLNLIGNAMSEYEKERIDVSKLEESKAMKPSEQTLLTMQADWKELCEAYYQDYLQNRFAFSVMPYQLYDEFVSCNMMAEDAYEDYVQEAIYRLSRELDELKLSAVTEAEKHEYRETIRKIENGEHNSKVERLSKKLAVEFLYKTAKEKGFINLFIKE